MNEEKYKDIWATWKQLKTNMRKKHMWRIECKKQKYKSRMNESFSNQRDSEGQMVHQNILFVQPGGKDSAKKERTINN